MRKNKLKSLWNEGKPATAGWISSGNTYITEVMAQSGYDALIIDMQHGMVSFDQVLSMLQAISGTNTLPLARVSSNDPASIMNESNNIRRYTV